MSYQIAQDFSYAGNDYWHWWAWIEADDVALDRIKEVVWILHPTFKQSRFTVNDRSRKFRLETAGWGTFLLRAEVLLENGEKSLLKHNLRLQYPDATTANPGSAASGTTDSRRPHTVFLSYSAQDSRAAAKLREGFKSAGLEVLDQTRIRTGEVWGDALRRMIAQSDAVVGLVGEDEISPWVMAEMEAAAAAEKPAFALLTEGTSGAGIPGNARPIPVDTSHFDVSPIVDLLQSRDRIE